MKVCSVLVPVNFYLLMTQFILTIVADYTKDNNVNSTIDAYKGETALDFTTESNYIIALIKAFYVLQGIELLSMLVSFTTFLNKLTVLKIILHLVSDLSLGWFIWQKWISYKILVPFLLGGVGSCSLELLSLFYVFRRKLNNDFKQFY